MLSENFLQQKCAVWSKNCFSNFCYILSFTWVGVGFVLVPDISLQQGYCLDIILLLSLVSDANTVEPELVLCLCLISLHGWGIVWISSYYCLWYLMPIQLSLSWFCAHAWYLLMAGVLFWYHLIIVFGIWCQYQCLFTTFQSPLFSLFLLAQTRTLLSVI